MQIAWNLKAYFSGKNKKNDFNMLSGEFAQRELKIKLSFVWQISSTFTSLLTNSADDKLMVFFFLGDYSHEMLKPVSGKIRNKNFRMSSAEILPSMLSVNMVCK